jgi:hypothetical protein
LYEEVQNRIISEPCRAPVVSRDSTAGGAILRPARFGKGDQLKRLSAANR